MQNTSIQLKIIKKSNYLLGTVNFGTDVLMDDDLLSLHRFISNLSASDNIYQLELDISKLKLKNIPKLSSHLQMFLSLYNVKNKAEKVVIFITPNSYMLASILTKPFTMICDNIVLQKI